MIIPKIARERATFLKFIIDTCNDSRDDRMSLYARRRRYFLYGSNDGVALHNRLYSHLDLVASFQRAVVNDLVNKTLSAAREHDVSTIMVTGGVAANSELRVTFQSLAAEEGLPVYFPSRRLSTDSTTRSSKRTTSTTGLPGLATASWATKISARSGTRRQTGH